MKPGAGKGKGSGFELDTCKRLSLWLSHGERTDLLSRSIGSGAAFTKALDRMKLCGPPGDVMAIHPLAHKFCSSYLVECKFWKNLYLNDFLRQKDELFDAMIKAESQATAADMHWMVLAKQNHRPVIMLLPAIGTVILAIRKAGIDYHLLFNERVYMVDQEQFLTNVSPELLLEDRDAR